MSYSSRLPQTGPKTEHDFADFYQELTSRNGHFISPTTQMGLRKVKILIAGCGSTGGACTQSLARVGVENFRLADNGNYELSNLNRQHAYLTDLGQNKALFQAGQLKAINPAINVHCHTDGITSFNVTQCVVWADLVFDAIDVTTSSAIEIKRLLHLTCKALRKPTLTALDLGFCQWGKTYDYRNPLISPLDDKLKAFNPADHPLKSLFSFVPLSAVPAHALPLVRDLLVNPNQPASQLGCTSDLLSAIVVPTVIQFVESNSLPKGWNIDLFHFAKPNGENLRTRLANYFLRRRIKKLLS